MADDQDVEVVLVGSGLGKTARRSRGLDSGGCEPEWVPVLWPGQGHSSRLARVLASGRCKVPSSPESLLLLHKRSRPRALDLAALHSHGVSSRPHSGLHPSGKSGVPATRPGQHHHLRLRASRGRRHDLAAGLPPESSLHILSFVTITDPAPRPPRCMHHRIGRKRLGVNLASLAPEHSAGWADRLQEPWSFPLAS